MAKLAQHFLNWKVLSDFQCKISLNQGRSQPHCPEWARFPLCSFFLKILINSTHFSSKCSNFLPHFGPLGGQVAHPGRPWLRYCTEHPSNLLEPSVHHITKYLFLFFFHFVQKREKGHMRLHHLNNVNRAIQVLDQNKVSFILYSTSALFGRDVARYKRLGRP